MTPEAQRIAIAEALGWTEVKGGWSGQQCFGYEKKAHGYVTRVPDYLNDLNAMNAAEQTLKPCRVSKGGEYPEESQQWGNYVLKLLKTCEAHGVSPCHASAAHRAESFLRCIGKWVE